MLKKFVKKNYKKKKKKNLLTFTFTSGSKNAVRFFCTLKL